jgi:hypothetical protein
MIILPPPHSSLKKLPTWAAAGMAFVAFLEVVWLFFLVVFR